MKLTNNVKSIAIGSFDGIHQGHRALISQVEAVLVIERNGGYLTPGYKRTFYFEQPCFFYHFDKIKALKAKEFVEKLKEDFPLLQCIVVGYDFGFGYKKEGNSTLLKELFSGEVIIVDEVKSSNISVHSRTIKSYIFNGEVELVKELLDRPFIISGKIISGQGLGKKELVPTLNLKVYDYDLPKHGVYASRTKIGERWLNSVTFLGHRISTDGSFSVESYVLDKDVGIVSGVLWIEFVSFIRMNKKFDGLKALKEQIVLDIEDSKRILKRETK
jgi:riboflavin kinase/FMN adenylyltransferase